MERILVVNPFGIGDVLFTTPLISALKKNSPAVKIGYLCNKRTQELVRSNPDVDWAFVFEKDEYRQLWRESKIKFIGRFLRLLAEMKEKKFDVAIDLSLNTRYGFFLWLMGIRRRIGYDYKGRGRFLSERIRLDSYSDKHMVDYYKDLALYLGVKPDGTAPRLFISDEDKNWAAEFLHRNGVRKEETLVGIAPGGGASWGKDGIYKRWTKEGFAQAADALAEKCGARILLFGDSADYGICESIANIMKHRPVLACGKAGLLKFAALLQRCSAVITNDGGPLHIAVAAGARTVSVFGPVDERVYGPYPQDGRHIVVKGVAACRPCYRNFRFQKCRTIECLRSIDARRVAEAAERLAGK